MRKTAVIFVSLLAVSFLGIETQAQRDAYRDTIPPFLLENGDTIKTFALQDIYVYPPQVFKNKGEEEKYRKLIRDIKKTLPYAKLIYATLIETYEYMMTLPDDKSREEHLKRMEKDLFAEYKPVLKKMTLSQGKLLIRLIDRECNQPSYDLLKAFLGPFRAGFWNFFAGMFGASLKSNWDPEGKDAAAERIIELVEMGLL
ncbi:MAG: DUF4294 domain-containing protein [Dysgonamonadaceae bacterium]|jgi:hypothetical protein|nr:DUF4294 domain-containing protein [Dysgonamonadaceae bacterium]